MDRLEFLVEERSMAEVLKVLLPRILPASWVLDENYFIRPHEGKSDLKRSIPKKLKGFAQHKEQTTGFIIIQDQDSNDCRQLKQELVALCKANQAPNIKFLVRIVCHELEAWYLGDMKAIQAVFPRFNPARHLKKSLFRLPDTCQNPKTRLKDIVGDYQQIATAQMIAPYIDIEHNRSESFRQFVSGIRKFITAKGNVIFSYFFANRCRSAGSSAMRLSSRFMICVTSSLICV
ncbi:MAG: DUF4276 family protein [Alistipes sp.]